MCSYIGLSSGRKPADLIHFREGRRYPLLFFCLFRGSKIPFRLAKIPIFDDFSGNNFADSLKMNYLTCLYEKNVFSMCFRSPPRPLLDLQSQLLEKVIYEERRGLGRCMKKGGRSQPSPFVLYRLPLAYRYVADRAGRQPCTESSFDDGNPCRAHHHVFERIRKVRRYDQPLGVIRLLAAFVFADSLL